MLSTLEIKKNYQSGINEPITFFNLCLSNSKQYLRSAGFFSSSVFTQTSLAFAHFLKNKGKMKLICSPELSKEDLVAISKSNNYQKSLENIINESTDKIINELENNTRNMLSMLINERLLEIKIAYKVNIDNTIGLYHPKIGIFIDSLNNQVSFTGSSNESKSGLINNFEDIDSFCSWKNQHEKKRCLEKIDSFYKIWNNLNPSAKAFTLPEAAKNKLLKCRSIESYSVENLDSIIEKICSLEQNKFKPSLPKEYKLRDYQTQAYMNWKKNSCKGIFNMATGTGKTITSINCALNLYKQNKSIQCIILVPRKDLSLQWFDELIKFNFKNIVIANSEYRNWKKNLSYLVTNSLIIENYSYFVIATYDTFITKSFQNLISDVGENTLLIADEAHEMGRKKMLTNYPINIENRIGLSATIKRHKDEIGTNKILEYFNETNLNDLTVNLGMQEAIQKGYLCTYDFYPEIVTLTENEQTEYNKLTKKIIKLYNSNSSEDSIKKYLIIRSKILQKAKNKLNKLRNIFLELKNQNKTKYIMVYVPEGLNNSMIESDLNEDKKMIDKYSEIISDEFNLSLRKYTGKTKYKDRKTILNSFSDGKIDALIAMKCLDEGIDVTRAEVGIFCSSTTNPKQYIQRRGRVLRLHKNKSKALIYDIMVKPRRISSDNNFFEWERNLIKKEIKRIKEFCESANNKYEALSKIEEIANFYNIEIYN